VGRAHKNWAQRARARLMAKLGAHCAHCGSTEILEFDCKVPTGDRHHRMDPSARMCYYHAQYRAGNLQVLCQRCNGAKGGYLNEDLCDLCRRPVYRMTRKGVAVCREHWETSEDAVPYRHTHRPAADVRAGTRTAGG
jgi:hypothetical protein